MIINNVFTPDLALKAVRYKIFRYFLLNILRDKERF